ncbi:MAG: Rieske 2Fe-2S domain-containing protein [Chloroflexota bacterium]|nr:Rieske 2Fe-2S domain-containing protein [Chloroflexota bacterium]MDE2970136.1 Rieske 2Fe-2S domain-containing protein [Chloroflexota bacterium]
MLTPEENKLVTQIGPETPMGDLFRRFWVPAFLSRELAEPDGTPARTRLLGEHIVGFRDTSGRLGILEAACPHRGVDLSYGINEENGLRCPRCGWKFDVEGTIVDMPLEPEEEAQQMMKDIRAVAYRAREWGGVIWTYMGPAGESAELPQFEWVELPAENRFITKYVQECNYLQGLEGGIDSTRIAYLYDMLFGDPPSVETTADRLVQGLQSEPAEAEKPIQTVAIKTTDYGLLVGASTEQGRDQSQWQLNQWLMPFYTTPKPEGEGLLGCLAWVPVDDRNTMVFAITYHPDRPLTEDEVSERRAGHGFHPTLEEGTYKRARNKENDYLIERKTSGANPLASISNQFELALVLEESMGAIVDRSKEQLDENDIAVVAARKMLMKAAIDLREGTEPAAAHMGHAYNVRAASTTLGKGETLENVE